MNISNKQVRLHGICATVWFLQVLLPAGTIIGNGVLFAADGNPAETSEKDKEIHRVRVLPQFRAGRFENYGNQNEMARPDRLLAKRIAEYLTKEKMPSPPLPATSSVFSPKDTSPPAMPDVYELFPVAWSLKGINLNRAFLPQLAEEAIVVVKFTPQYFKADAFPEGNWVVACLRNRSRLDESETPTKRIWPYDSVSSWDICLSPELADAKGTPGILELEFRPNIKCFKSKPTMEQLSEFIQSTNFGNNDIHGHTLASEYMEVEVMQVVVYSEYSKLQGIFHKGLSPEVVEQRKAAYGEAFKRATIETRP